MVVRDHSISPVRREVHYYTSLVFWYRDFAYFLCGVQEGVWMEEYEWHGRKRLNTRWLQTKSTTLDLVVRWRCKTFSHINQLTPSSHLPHSLVPSTLGSNTSNKTRIIASVIIQKLQKYTLLLTTEDDGEEDGEDELSVEPKRRETYGLIYERESRKNPMPTAKAGAQCCIPMPSLPAWHGGRWGRWGKARPMGASEESEGGHDWWGQARPMGAVSHWPHARARHHGTLGKPPGQIPRQHSPFGPRPSRQTKPYKHKPKILFQIPNPIKSKSKENPSIQYRSNWNPNKQCNPNPQSETREIQSPARDPIEVQSPPQAHWVWLLQEP